MNAPIRASSPEVLPAQLLAARTRLGLSRAQLSKTATVSTDAIAGLERNGSGQVGSLVPMLAALGCRLSGHQPGTSIGSWLRELRESHGLGQREAAAASGLSQPTIISLERSSGRVSSLCAVLRAYGTHARLAFEYGAAFDMNPQASKGIGFEFYNEDCRDRLKVFAAEGRRFQSCVTDPPYHITNVAAWDKGNVAFDKATWRAVYEVMLPGAYVLAFAAPRTAHKTATALEEAGFEIRDSIAWLAVGPPWGSRDVSKAIDARLGHERVVTGYQQKAGKRSSGASIRQGLPGAFRAAQYTGEIRDQAISEEAKQWSGFKTRLKPGREDIIVAMRPYSESSVEANVLRWGVGGLNIDGTRLPGQVQKRRSPAKQSQLDTLEGMTEAEVAALEPYWLPSDFGRYPSNVVLGEGFDDETWQHHFHVAKPIGKHRYGHPAAKPVKLLRMLLKLCTPPGGVCLDPFAGCGSVGHAASMEKLSYVGIEIDADYAEVARKRLAELGN